MLLAAAAADGVLHGSLPHHFADLHETDPGTKNK